MDSVIAMEYMENTSKQEILDAIGAFAVQVDRRFDGVDQRFDGIDQRFDSFEAEITGAIHGLAQHMDARFAEQDKRFDKKFEDFKTDIVLLTKKSSIKLTVLVDRLVAEGSLKRATGDFILAMEPFAQ